jgi:hypothetical protein
MDPGCGDLHDGIGSQGQLLLYHHGSILWCPADYGTGFDALNDDRRQPPAYPGPVVIQADLIGKAGHAA